MTAPSPLHTRLPRIGPAEAGARNAWLAALDGQAVDGGWLKVRVSIHAAPVASAMAFAAGEGRVHLHAEILDGQPAYPVAESPALPETLVALSRLEPLIAAVERACGRALDPVGLSAPPADALVLDVEASDPAGRIRHRAHLYVPQDLLAGRAAAPRIAPEALARLRTPCRLRLRGPAAPRADLARLEAGDIVLLSRPAGLFEAALEVGNRAWRGGFSPTGAFHLRQEDHGMLDDPPSQPDAAPLDPAPAPAAVDTGVGVAGVSDLPVRLHVVLPDLTVSVAALVGLAPGAVLSLPLKGEDLPVRLLADGTEIAAGRLVSLGDAYGVLIDAVTGASATA